MKKLLWVLVLVFSEDLFIRSGCEMLTEVVLRYVEDPQKSACSFVGWT